VEGFGLPVAEAHLLGVPVIASDIAAHREVAGNGALYLSPLDGTGWREAILRLATDDALRDRLVEGRPRPQTWDAHFATVFPRLEEIAR
jgi:glycosyltransferase involved in cell wall biosynthesis